MTRFLRSQFERADRGVARALDAPARRRACSRSSGCAWWRAGPPASRPPIWRPALGEEVAKADLRVTPLRQVLAYKLGIEIASARETVSAVPLEARAARELGCRAGMASFRSDRVSVAADGTAVVYDRVFIPGDRFRITRDLRYGPDQPRRQPRGDRVLKILVMVKQVPDTATQVKISGDPKAIETTGHHLDRLPLRRVRHRGGAPDQGEARPGRGGGGDAGPRPGQGGAALLPGHGRRPGRPPARSRLGRRRTR